MHKKPDRPFATIRFAKDGSVSPNVEHTDLPQKELELVVAKKFCSTLQARSLTTLTNLQRGNDPADVRATNERGELILIQIVEVVMFQNSAEAQAAGPWGIARVGDRASTTDRREFWHSGVVDCSLAPRAL